MLDRIIEAADRLALQVFVRNRVGPAVADLGWEPRPGEGELTRQLRGDLLRTLGILGGDPTVRDRAGEVYAKYLSQPTAVDADVVTAVIAILADAGDAARYDEFFRRYRDASGAGKPQETQRYLDALAGFQQPDLQDRTRKYAIDPAVIRPQDAPAVVRALLVSVSGRDTTWVFVKDNWSKLNDLYRPSGLRQMCKGLVGLATPELRRDARRFFTERQIDLGGKTLEQYLEQLDVIVGLRGREGAALHDYLTGASRRGEAT
jgi:puromycin-sensitive aminopeptidase